MVGKMNEIETTEQASTLGAYEAIFELCWMDETSARELTETGTFLNRSVPGPGG